jgi:outer membrane receptor protein involved in Fe transport
MKKIITTLGLCGLLFATDIKDNQFFIGVNAGNLTIHKSSFIWGVKAGYYFYDPNSYKINNRFYLDINKVSSSADFYITSLKIDWIKNNSTNFSPFLGLNIGYLYFEDKGYDYSSNAWGGQIGVLYKFTNNFSLEMEWCYQKPFKKKKVWNTPLKTLKGGIEISF